MKLCYICKPFLIRVIRMKLSINYVVYSRTNFSHVRIILLLFNCLNNSFIINDNLLIHDTNIFKELRIIGIVVCKTNENSYYP